MDKRWVAELTKSYECEVSAFSNLVGRCDIVMMLG